MNGNYNFVFLVSYKEARLRPLDGARKHKKMAEKLEQRRWWKNESELAKKFHFLSFGDAQI